MVEKEFIEACNRIEAARKKRRRFWRHNPLKPTRQDYKNCCELFDIKFKFYYPTFLIKYLAVSHWNNLNKKHQSS